MHKESALKSALMQKLKELPRFVVFRHEDVRTSGIPDFTTTAYARTCWWEVKHATPDFKSKGVQELTCLRLAAAGFCRYIVYIEDSKGESKRTLIVHPRNIGTLDPEASCVGHDHRFVMDFILKAHSI